MLVDFSFGSSSVLFMFVVVVVDRFCVETVGDCDIFALKYEGGKTLYSGCSRCLLS